jgi:hypothetical protein
MKKKYKNINKYLFYYKKNIYLFYNMSLSFLEFFNLDESFTKKDLDKSYNKKMDDIESMNISSSDKKFYKMSIDKAFDKAERYLDRSLDRYGITLVPKHNLFYSDPAFDNLLSFRKNLFNDLKWNKNENNFSSSVQKSYSKILNPDKSFTVTERSLINKNGKIEKIDKKYKKYPDGRIEYL